MVNMAEEHVQKWKQRMVLSAAKRARLEETFKRASKKPTSPQDIEFAIELLAQCVIGDPGNPTYVRAYLENLQRKYQNKKGSQSGWFKDRAAHTVLKKALAQRQWDEAIRHGLQALRGNPWDVPTLTQMATAAKGSGDGDSELCYLKAALTKAPKDPTCNRLAAIALDEMGLVNQAIVFWERVAAALPKDQQAKEALSAFQVGAKAQGVARRGPTAEEQEEMVRQREIQQQEEKARQQKIREEEEKARQQRMQEEAAIEAESVESELDPYLTDQEGDSGEKARLIGVSETADSAYKEGYEYDIREPTETRKKIDPFSLGIVAVAWLIMLVFVTFRWGPDIWKQMQEYASFAWIGFGVILFALAMALRIWQRP